VSDQIALLRQRGMTIADDNRASHYINFIGYYRLSGYFRCLRQSGVSEDFRRGVTFDHVLDLYVFDRKLRVLLADALERIEVAVKSSLSNAGALADGPFWMCNPANFDHGLHARVLSEIKEVTAPNGGKSHHAFIMHFSNFYSDPFPPCWMIVEALSFGAISRIYKITKGNIRRPTAEAFKIQQDILESWLHSLVFVRNLCAHSCRVWNRVFTIQPKIPKCYNQDIPTTSRTRLCAVCCLLQHVMTVIADATRPFPANQI
jgi:abortive infection bacteriophage resistance protein